MPRPLSVRERGVLDALLAIDFPGVADLRAQVVGAVVVGGCDCGCPSINFSRATGSGIHIRVDATIDGSPDGLFLFTRDGHLGGIEYVGASVDGLPDELPDPARLAVTPA